MAQISLTRGGPESGGNFEFSWSNDFIESFLLSDVGQKRSQNEDFCLICAPEKRKEGVSNEYLFAVADGMGGVKGGEFASRAAVETIAEEYYASAGDNVPSKLQHAVSVANERVYEEAQGRPEYRGMGTTVSVLVVRGDAAYIAQVGDSRIYLLRGHNKLAQLTEDHSLVAEQVRSGYLSEEEARNHSLKNLITRAVGTQPAIQPDLFSLQLALGDSILLCSDGLSNMVADEDIGRAMRRENLEAAAQTLVRQALDAGGPDNITVAALRIVKTPERVKRDGGAVDVSPESGNLFNRIRRLFRQKSSGHPRCQTIPS
jgi:protein phosphatase